MARRTLTPNRTLSFQQLEDRRLMAGDVSVVVKNGTINITGDNKDDAIVIEQVGSGQYKIFGTTGGNTTINKQSTPQTFTGVTGDFNIDLKGGNDDVDFENVNFGQAVTLPRNLTIKDVGNDVMNVNNVNVLGNVSLTGGSGNRVISFDNTAISGGFSANLGSGGTILYFINASVGSPTVNAGKNDTSIKLGNGGSIVEIFNAKFERDLTANMSSNNNDDSIFEVDGGTVGRNASVTMGNGTDHVSLNNFAISEKLTVKTGNGNDQVALGGIDNTVIGSASQPAAVTADQIYVDLGKGNDTLKFGGNGAKRGGGVIANSATYLGDAGVDSVFNDTNSAGLPGTFTGFETMPPKIIPLVVVASTKF